MHKLEHSVAIKIITNDDTIEEIINPDFSACGSGNVILKRNQPCKGDALDFVTTAAKSDQHACRVRRKKLKYSGNDEQINPIPSIPKVCLATSTNSQESKVSHAGQFNLMSDVSLSSLPVVNESGSVETKAKRRKRTRKHAEQVQKKAKKIRRSSDREIQKLQRQNTQAKRSLRKPFVQSKDPVVSSPLPPLDSCNAETSCVAKQKWMIDQNSSKYVPLSPSGPSVLKPCTSALLHYSLENVNFLMEQKIAKINASHSRREATALMQTKIKSTMGDLEMSEIHQAISFKEKDSQSTTSFTCQRSDTLGTVTTSVSCQQSNTARTVVITPPPELIHVTPSGKINYSDIIKKGILQLFDRNASQIVLLIHLKQTRTYQPLPRRCAFRVTKKEGTLHFEPTEFPPKKHSAGGKRKLNTESLSSDMDVGERIQSKPESSSSDTGVDKRKSPRDHRGTFTCNTFSDLGSGNELSAASGNSKTDLTISFMPGTAILTHDAAASAHCGVEEVVSTGSSNAINSTVTTVPVFTRDISSVSDPRTLQTRTVSLKDKCHLKTVEVTIHASADKAVHFDPEKHLLPHPAESSTASSFSCEVTPACDKHPETSEESLNTSITLQPVTKTLQVLNSAIKPQATTRPMQSIECSKTSKAATETEQTLNSPTLPQSTETTQTLNPLIVPQSTETTQTLRSPITTQSADKFQPFTLKKSTRLQKLTKMTKPFPSNFTNPAAAEMSQSARAGEVVLPSITDDSQLIPSTVNSTPITLADIRCPEKNTGESSLVAEGSQPVLRTSDLQQVSLARVAGSHSTVSESDKVSSDADENSVTSTNSFDSPLYQWTKSDVARWLNFHRLGRYASQ
ncbi:unnamed protein product [Lymnaea stagnalis]|uniref:SAM domain-containing protein n=1 Tax=Lymnaea stagnalis TaxID=6523 RepID=A0AAV2IKM0_LYMST